MKKNKTNHEVIKNKFILFVSGMSVNSINAIENITKIGNKYLDGKFELEIIDINKEKHQAAHYQIIGLPTLIKIEPSPVRTILGDLSETDKVLKILNIS